MSNNSQRVGFDIERSRLSTTFNGTYLAITTPGGQASLTEVPTVIVFDNQTDVEVPISVDGINVWKTFSAGEAFVLDLRANHGIAANYTIDFGTTFYTNAAVGTTGSFRISIIYAR
jgi:hypothetical protein